MNHERPKTGARESRNGRRWSSQVTAKMPLATMQLIQERLLFERRESMNNLTPSRRKTTAKQFQFPAKDTKTSLHLYQECPKMGSF